MRYLLMNIIIYISYIVSLIISVLFIDNSDIATLLIPIIFYTTINIVIRNSNQSLIYEKRSNDINDFVLIAYVIVYIFVKINLWDIKDCLDRFNQSYIGGDEVVTFVFMFAIMFISISVLFLLIYGIFTKLSEYLNPKSHWYNNIKEKVDKNE